MHPITDIDVIGRLRELATEAKNYQLERGLSDARICSDFPGLGSTKTYKRILNDKDDLDQLDLDKQLRNYEATIETIRARRLKDKLAEPEYEDFQNVINVRAALVRAMDEDSHHRLVCVEGESATGKDAALNFALKKWPAVAVAINANPFWSESLAVPTRTIFEKLNIVRKYSREEGGGPIPMPRYPEERAQVIFEELKSRRLMLLFNEAHHFGVRMLDFVKTLINETPSVVGLFFVPALLRKLESQNFAQTNQLFANRLCERVYLPSPPADDIGEMLQRRGVRFESTPTKSDAEVELAREAPALGNWTYVKLVTRELAAASKKAPLTIEQFNALRAVVRNRRIPRQLQGRAA